MNSIPHLKIILFIIFIFLIFLSYSCIRLNFLLGRSIRLLQEASEKEKFRLASNILTWAIKCIRLGIPKPIYHKNFEDYNKGYITLNLELEHLRQEILEFNETYVANPELLRKNQSKEDLYHCKENAISVLEDLKETITFHSKLEETYNLSILSMPDMSEELQKKVKLNQGFVAIISCLDTAQEIVKTIKE